MQVSARNHFGDKSLENDSPLEGECQQVEAILFFYVYIVFLI